MLLRRIAIENVRSFLEREELTLDGQISILIGPNGGGKTNLLDIAVILLRRFLLASMYPEFAPTDEQPDRYIFRANDQLNQLQLERHSMGAGKPQLVEVELEVTQRDCDNMLAMKNAAAALAEKAAKKYVNLQTKRAADWKLEEISKGTRFTYKWSGNFEGAEGPAAEFLQYMNSFEVDSYLRAEFEVASLSTPMIYLPVNCSGNAFNSSVELANYNEHEYKRQNDASISRTPSSIVPLSIGRLAQKYRLLLEKDKGNTRAEFGNDPNIKELTARLQELGYGWELVSKNPLKNAYDIHLKKQGSSFNVGAASSGERELLTYLFAIFALNVRDALIVVDEPELHLHPHWQKSLLRLFTSLSQSTGNQFLLATHSPTFVSPDSIQFISRVYSREQRSHILRLAASELPNAKHLLNIVNSQNNESIFFADEVVLVEGLSDRIFFEAVLDRFGRGKAYPRTLEVISVGGKGLFPAYGKLLDACRVPYSIIADRDYIEQVGSEDVKKLFQVNAAEIKQDVIEDIASWDADALVKRIDEAIASGSWGDAQNVWEYIKSRRKKLNPNLSAAQKQQLRDFIIGERGERVYILNEGDLESYLPDGYRSKNLEKLISLLSTEAFWDLLSQSAQDELAEVAALLMPAA